MWRSIQVSVFFLGACSLFGQEGHTYTPGDIQDGERVFLGQCARCHGPDGTDVQGVDLSHNSFKHGTTDEDLIGIIRNGIPGTAMPPHTMTPFVANTVVAFMRNMATGGAATVRVGNAKSGKAVFEGKGNCLSCHRVRGNGARSGPELTDIGAARRAVEIQDSILNPDAQILPPNRSVKLVTKKGESISGRLLNQDGFTVQVFDSRERMLSFQRADLKEFTILDRSPMPSYKGKLTDDELADLVGYLVSLKGINQ
jgi:putative heme-binding domain-containing protein